MDLKNKVSASLQHHVTRKHLATWVCAIIVLFIIAEVFTIYFIFIKSEELSKALNQTEDRLDEKINLNKAETQSVINSLTDAITSISSEQTNLKEQISEVKAKASSDFSSVLEDVLPGVVTIKTDISQATGFIITSDGYVVTNAHVLSGAKLASVYTFDNKKYPAALVGYSSPDKLDVALLKILGTFSELDLGNSDDVKVGEKVIAIGNPLGLSFTATEGIISAKDREGFNNLPYYFQTDVSLNPGNSGGPLLNTKGEVIGINNFKVSGAEGLGFSLEINYAKDVINEITSKTINAPIF